jgi:hypothetical protein
MYQLDAGRADHDEVKVLNNDVELQNFLYSASVAIVRQLFRSTSNNIVRKTAIFDSTKLKGMGKKYGGN